MTKFLGLIVFLGLSMHSCTHTQENSVHDTMGRDLKSKNLIDSAIAYHGGDRYLNSYINFGFRDKLYSVSRTASSFTYKSVYRDSLGKHEHKLTNAGFEAYLNDIRVALPAKDSMAQARTLNSVVYFALLPSFLKDVAVEHTIEGEEKIKGKDYYRLKVTFGKDGGGEDHDDVYLYWFDKQDYSMDYLAYSFHVNRGGTRFRAAINSRRINGIVFQNYENFEGPSPDSLRFISEMYKADKLNLLSMIEISKISV